MVWYVFIQYSYFCFTLNRCNDLIFISEDRREDEVASEDDCLSVVESETISESSSVNDGFCMRYVFLK